MKESDDPLDLLHDDGDGVVEMCLLAEEEKRNKDGDHKKTGCCVVFFMIGSSMVIAGWCMSQLV